MTPDLMEAGAQRLSIRGGALAPTGNTESGGREAGSGRIATPGEVDVTHGRILYLEDVCVSFDGFKAINNLSLDIAPGELRCIIGPNGAGKTTMMDIITGKTRPDSGTVFFGSTIDLLRYREADFAGAVEAARRGLGIDRMSDPLWRVLVAALRAGEDPVAAERAAAEYDELVDAMAG